MVFAAIITIGGYFVHNALKSVFPKFNIPILSSSKTVGVEEGVASAWKTLAETEISQNSNYKLSDTVDNTDIQIVSSSTAVQNAQANGKVCEPLYQTDYFPVMRFATINDGISLDKLKKIVAGTDDDYSLVLPEEFSEGVLNALDITTIVSDLAPSTKEQVISYLNADKTAVSLVPTSWLEPRMKILEIDGVFPLEVDGMFRVEGYICAKEGDLDDPVAVALKTAANIDIVDKDNVATVIQTGVAAMGRNIVTKIKSTGDPAWVARKIGSFLADADLTHTSNEVSFADNCTQAKGTMRFCALPSSIAALKESGIDLIELTGNHNNDWGRSANTNTINLYKESNIAYFGGGLDLEDARKPYITEVKGTKLGFLGYNYYDSIVSRNTVPLANSTGPGANPYDSAQVKADIEALRAEVDIIVVDFQFQECWCYSQGNTVCYRNNAVPNQEKVFRQAVEWGADIVVGTQAHQPQGFEMRSDGAIFYGLGNLFFDQTVYTGTKEELIIKHYFYSGNHLTTRVYTAFYDKDYQPYLTTGTERETLLAKVFP